MPYTPTVWVNDTTPAINAANLNHLETGVQAAAATADAAVPKSLVTTAGDILYATASAVLARLGLGAAGTVLKGGASAPSWATIVNADVDVAAAIVRSKLNFGSGLVDADVATGAAIALAKLADPGSGNVVTSAGSGAVAAKPPGYEVGYDQITGAVTVSSSTESSGTTIISCGAHVFDGSPVIAEFFAPTVDTVGAGYLVINLFESTTQIGRLCVVEGATAINLPVIGKLRFTPSAASHTYTVSGFFITTGNPVVGAGAGSTGTNVPAYIRFTKV